MPTIKFVDAQTGEEFEREMTPDEIAAWEADNARIRAEEESKQAARQEILNKLGLTEEEAKLLLG